MTENNREIWLDYIRAFAALFVVLLHVSSNYSETLIQSSSNNGFIFASILVNSFTRVCVPLFFMISGYLFFVKTKPRFKHFRHIFATLIFYSAISVIFIFFTQHKLVINFFKNTAFYHLWFLYVIPVVYFFAIFIRIDKKPIKLVTAILIFIVIFIFLNQKTVILLDYFFPEQDFSYIFQLPFIHNWVYLIYAFLGAIFSQVIFNKNLLLVRYISLFIYIGISIIDAILVKNLSVNEFNITFFHPSMPFISIQTISFFIFIKTFENRLQSKNCAIILSISNNSLTLYGVHAFVLLIMIDIIVTNNPYTGIILRFISTIIISYMIALIMKKLDKNRYIT